MNYFISPCNSLKIAFDIFPASIEKGRVLFLPGRAEYYLKYGHFFKILNENGFSVYTMDHRGQGASGRMLEDRQKGFTKNFNDFVEDADFFLKNYVVNHTDPSMKIYSISHSMGGAVSLLLGVKNPGLFQKMIFCSPMWGIYFEKMSEKTVYCISKLLCLLGKGKDYAPGKGPFNFKASFENNRLTHDPDRFKEQRAFLKEHPDFILGGPTNKWVYESLKMIRKLKLASLKPESEILLLQAEKDSVVSNIHQNLIIKRLDRSEKFVLGESWHELLFEEKSIYYQVVNKIISFLNA